MSKDINLKAYKQAEKELLEKKVTEVKGYILKTLEKMEEKKKEKSKVEEELRILKLDLEDLRNGKFKKIEERNKKSEVAKKVSVYDKQVLVVDTRHLGIGVTNLSESLVLSSKNWQNYTAGTYNLANGDSRYF